MSRAAKTGTEDDNARLATLRANRHAPRPPYLTDRGRLILDPPLK